MKHENSTQFIFPSSDAIKNHLAYLKNQQLNSVDILVYFQTPTTTKSPAIGQKFSITEVKFHCWCSILN